MGGAVKDDRRKAWFGGAIRQTGISDASVLNLHPHAARLHLLQVVPTGTALAHLPELGSRHLAEGFCLAVKNIGAGGDGDVKFVDSVGDTITTIAGASSLAPGESCHIYLRGFASEDVPVWDIIARTAGAYAVP